ncbi:TPA: BppU family phage baseplate upper protein [Bacillus anthracis]|nr:BppU family phage baseplate upper protein [Bacillus anthracis]
MQHKEFNVKEEELKLIRFYQNDLNSAKLLINVTHDKVVTDFSSATSVQIAFLKPDCKRVFQDVQNVNQMQGKYYVVLSTQTLIAYGNVIAQLRFTFPNNKVIETCKFAFTVDESIMSDDAMKSTNEFPVIQKAIEAGKKFEGVDIDGIIAAGELAKGALPKTGGTMTGNLRMSKIPASGNSWRSISWDLDNAEAIRMGMNGSNYFVLWDAPQNAIPFEYRPTTKEVRLGSGGSVNILGDTNVVKKTEIYSNFVQPNGRAYGINGTDLNTVVSSGYYSGSNLTNAPEGLTSYFYVEVNAHGTGTHVKQEATLLNSAVFRKFFRIMNNNVWQPWVDLTRNSKDGRATLTLTADATAGSSNPQLATRRGNTVSLSLDLMRNAGATSAIVTTLPSDMTPVDSYTFDAIATDGTPSRVLIRFNGEIHLDVTGKRYRILATYVCN